MSWRSRAISLRSCSRLGGLVADRTVAIVSRPISNGPPGSAREMAIPATNGARRILIHSSSGNASFVVTVAPLLSLVANIREATTHSRGQAHPGGVIVERGLCPPLVVRRAKIPGTRGGAMSPADRTDPRQRPLRFG